MQCDKMEGFVSAPAVSHHHGASGLFLHAQQLPNSEGHSIFPPIPSLVSGRSHLVSVDPCQV
uniref:Proannomuricatin AD n=1 Tax=Annona muricata TaxID=13337 RepID=A0A5B9T7F6_ANNMU|nr:proannomuricatin AD [Annona muricata]